MKSIKLFSLISMSLVMGAMVVFSSCGASGAGKKSKGIVLQEGDRAEITSDNDFTTITFPAELTSDDMAFYDTDLLGYLLGSNAPISTNGSEYDAYRI